MDFFIAISGRFNEVDEKGFTLMEVLVATAIGIFFVIMMYKVVTANNKSVALQMRKAEIQQNLRASFFVVEAEIKSIGFNPMILQAVHAPGITYADKARLSYQADLNENGRSFSSIPYSGGNVSPATDPYEETTIDLGNCDANGDGIADSLSASLMRDKVNINGNLSPLVIANNVEVLNFVYLDMNGNVVNGTPSSMIYPVIDSLLSEIKKIQVTIVVRSSTERSDYVNSHKYINDQGQEILPVMNDGFDRMLLSKTIDCRNLGLL